MTSCFHDTRWIKCTENRILPLKITLVDDVVPRGSTLAACVALVREQFPVTDIKTFGMVRTCVLVPEVETILYAAAGVIQFQHGFLQREP